MQEGTRSGADCAFRMGGEEMVCILNCPPEKAMDIAERLREKVENTVHHITVNTCPACIKNNNVEKLLRYKKKHNDEYEAQYIKVYQRWYTRIRRAKEKGQLTGDKLQLCDDIFSNFTSESYEKRNAVRSGEISPEAFFQWINEFDNRMNIANDRKE